MAMPVTTVDFPEQFVARMRTESMRAWADNAVALLDRFSRTSAAASLQETLEAAAAMPRRRSWLKIGAVAGAALGAVALLRRGGRRR